MQVLTLDPQALDLHAAKLAQMVEEGKPHCFDAIVAVRRGGSIVCDSFCKHFPKERFRERYDVSLQRPSTKRKNADVSKILKKLPLPLLDFMRMAESALLEMCRRIKSRSSSRNIDIPESLANTFGNSEAPEILIIDDAIDSGDTLYAIVKSLLKLNSKSIVSIAVMTETTRNPRLHADYAIYRNRTLIRFPWSNDYKKSR